MFEPTWPRRGLEAGCSGPKAAAPVRVSSQWRPLADHWRPSEFFGHDCTKAVAYWSWVIRGPASTDSQDIAATHCVLKHFRACEATANVLASTASEPYGQVCKPRQETIGD